MARVTVSRDVPTMSAICWWVSAGVMRRPPVASSLNHTAGVNRANELVTEVDTNGDICIYTNAAIDLIVDVAGYVDPPSDLQSMEEIRGVKGSPRQDEV